MTSATAPDLDRLVATLDLEAKVRLLTGATMFTLSPEPRIGLAELRLSDGPTGVRGLKFSGGRVVSLFPSATVLASAWDEGVMEEVGRLLAEEAMAQQVHVVLGPTINLHRSLLGGRLFEAFSEDPLLSGRLAAAYVRGMQEQGVAACLKHLVANESETERTTVDSVVDEATLRELYLLPFEIAVEESHPWSIMAAYNDVNGVPATEQAHVMQDVLRGEWSWDGLVMSDWSATKSAAPAAAGGLDLVMPGPMGPWGQALVDAVRSGELAEGVVDEHVRRLLLLAERVGALGEPRSWPGDLPAPDSDERREQLTRLAAQGMTVLTNDGVLPLERGTTVALVGRHALETIDMGGGSAQVNPPYQVSVAEGLTALLGDGVTVTDGVEVRAKPVPARPGYVTDPETGEPGVHLSLLGADGRVLEDRHGVVARTAVGLDDEVDDVIVRVRFRARVQTGGRVELGVLGVGDWRVEAPGHLAEPTLRVSGAGHAEEILAPPAHTSQVELPDGAVVEATVTLLGGGVRPGETEMGFALGLLARPAPRDDVQQVLAEAAEAAAAADVAVVVVGLTEEEETEAVDKATLRLPGEQDALVRAVAAAARRTVVVVNAGTPVLMPWLDEVDAVLVAGLPGQEGGHAVAAALLGDQEPAGRLVTTIPVADGAAPAWSVTPVDGKLVYEEGTAIGYRGHDAGLAPPPAFWLGHGLGYSTWDWTGARLVPETGGTGDSGGSGSPGSTARTAGVSVEVTVHNTGSRSSREVVQLYWRPAASGQPVRLVGWAAATVAAGEQATVRVSLDPRLRRRWDVDQDRWDLLPLAGELLLARGLGDVRARLELPG